MRFLIIPFLGTLKVDESLFQAYLGVNSSEWSAENGVAEELAGWGKRASNDKEGHRQLVKDEVEAVDVDTVQTD